MGAVLVPLLVGLEQAPSLPHASSLCGACTDACPVKIPLHELLLELRRDLVDEGVAPLVASGSPSGSGRTPGRRRSATGCRRGSRGSASRSPGSSGRAAAGRAGRALPRLGRRYRDRPMSLVDDFARNAEAARASSSTAGDAPDDRGRGRLAGALRRSPTRAASSSPPRPDEPRARSLLPDVHVTLLAEDRILPGLDELFAAVGDDLPSALAIVTGPSRSADIEQKLAVGVHGPGEVHVVLMPPRSR